MLSHQGAGNHQPIGEILSAGVTNAGGDFSSCWLALPDGIRQRLEPMLTSRVAPVTRSARRMRAVAAR